MGALNKAAPMIVFESNFTFNDLGRRIYIFSMLFKYSLTRA